MRSRRILRVPPLQWLGILLMLLVAARPVLQLACDIHELAHGSHELAHSDAAPALDDSAGEGMPEGVHAFLHLGFCCGHLHLAAAPLFPVSVAWMPVQAGPDRNATAQATGWTGLSPFRPPITV